MSTLSLKTVCRLLCVWRFYAVFDVGCESRRSLECVIIKAVPNILFGPDNRWNSVFVFCQIVPHKLHQIQIITFNAHLTWLLIFLSHLYTKCKFMILTLTNSFGQLFNYLYYILRIICIWPTTKMHYSDQP